MITPARTPLSASGLGMLGAMTGDLVGGDEELQRQRERKKKNERNENRRVDKDKRKIRKGSKDIRASKQ